MARDRPDEQALVTEDRTFTFSELRQEVRHAAAALIELGLRPGDRVGLWSTNTWHWVVGCLGVHYAGAVLVPMNTTFTAEEATDILARGRVSFLIAMDSRHGTDPVADLDHAALPDLRRIVRIPAAGRDRVWADLLAGPRTSLAEVDARSAAVRPEDVAVIMFTSGTTGRSKGVVCAHQQSLSGSSIWVQCGLAASDRSLCINPFFHVFGYMGGIFACLQTGATLVPQRSFDPVQTMRVIAEQRITVLPAPPTVFQVLLDHPARNDYDLSSLRLAVTGAAVIPVVLIERLLDELSLETVLTGYGLTESNGWCTVCRPGDDAVTVATTSGRPTAGFEVRIESPDDTGRGEVVVRGPNTMLGYFDDPEATAAVIDAEGWFHTGDVGSFDERGNLRITGRLKDMYICGGFNVYPAEIEQVLTRIDGVADAAVIGVPHDRLGEVGRAFIVPHPGRDLTEHHIITSARQHLAAYKTPRSVVFLDALPRNASGKVLKTALRDIPHTPAPPATPPGLGGPPVGAAENWIADAWQLLLNIERPGRRDRFTDLGGDSLAAVEFSQMLRTRFDIDMSVDTLAELPTIADIVAALAAPTHRQRHPAVRLQTSPTGPICLLIPGIGGHAWTFAATAAAMTTPCDLWALSLLDLREGPPDQIRERIHDAALETLAPYMNTGRPILIGGYSFGALIATDLTTWLTTNGVPVAELLLIDPDPLDTAPVDWSPRTLHKPPGKLAIEPGSPAARQLATDASETARILEAGYLNRLITLPQVPVSWLRSRMMAAEQASAATVFGMPTADVDQTVVDLDHLDLIRIPHVTHLAGWLDGRLAMASERR